MPQPTPVQAPPVQAAPATPVQAAPVQYAAPPAQVAPVQTAPAQAAPVQPAPVQAAPVQSAPVQAPPAPRKAAAPRPKAAAPARRSARGGGGEAAWGQAAKRPRPVRGGSRDEVGWVKAHGGSGATSLVEAFGGVDVGARWPDPARGEPRRIVLVGRTSARGLQSVSQALGALKDGNAPQGLDLLAVVLVADAPGRLPLTLLRRIRVLRSVTRVHRVPWIPAWRTGGRPRSVPRQLATLAKLVGGDLYGEGAAS
ncbi:hypothetical protein AB0912_10490 [Streptomyces sp. NPDC007084]|uniref:hypothetical protein n=1 Tax=Streptomyces sp. NPDC007084 TaxID=3154313 RepID=UPI00345205C2